MVRTSVSIDERGIWEQGDSKTFVDFVDFFISPQGKLIHRQAKARARWAEDFVRTY